MFSYLKIVLSSFREPGIDEFMHSRPFNKTIKEKSLYN